MKINVEVVLKARKGKSWSQDELALASGLNLRTIQRIEREAVASLQSKKALAGALDIDTHDLDYEETRMKRCPECDSNQLYEYDGFIDTTTIGGGLLPELGSGMLESAKVRPMVCTECGFLKFYAAKEATEKLSAAKHWRLV